MKSKLAIFGASTTARAIYKFVKDYDLYDIIGFVQDKEYKTEETYCDLPIYDFESLASVFDKSTDFMFVAVEWNRLNADRKKFYNRLKAEGFRLANIVSPTAMIHGSLKGDNCWICDYVVVENDAEIGNDVLIKAKSTIQHNVIVEDHCFLAAHSLMAGNAHVGEQSYIGVASVIFNGVNIGKKCLVGGGVTVKRHLPDFSIIKTPNDQFVIKTYSEEEIEDKLLASIKIR